MVGVAPTLVTLKVLTTGVELGQGVGVPKGSEMAPEHSSLEGWAKAKMTHRRKKKVSVDFMLSLFIACLQCSVTKVRIAAKKLPVLHSDRQKKSLFTKRANFAL